MRTGENVNIFYSDRAPELVKAADQLEWKRVKFHCGAKYQARHRRRKGQLGASWITTRVIRGKALLRGSQLITPIVFWWKFRFGEEFPGPYLPFGSNQSLDG